MLQLVARGWHRSVAIVSGEWMLTFRQRRPNGGSIVLARSLWCSATIYVGLLLLRELLDPNRSWEPSCLEIRLRLLATMPWYGAIFTACYASLYTRFASQWSYLAALYNQIVSAQISVEAARGEEAVGLFVPWKAGFIEDADDLHLATKPLFAHAVLGWLGDPAVRAWFEAHSLGGLTRLNQIESAARHFTHQHKGELKLGVGKPESATDA